MEKDEKIITETTMALSLMFSLESMFGSKRSLWKCGLDCGLVSKELYEKAEKFYGRLWNYAGD